MSRVIVMPGLRSVGLLVLVALLPFLLSASPAHGHEASSHDFESIPEAIDPPALGTGIGFEMLDYDARLVLRNDSGRSVVVMGYEGEPYARLDPDGGVYLNSRSPAFYLNQDRYARTPVDPSADPSAAPEWVREADDGTLIWYDRRSHTMSSARPASVEDPAEPQVLRDYRIPLEIDGEPAALKGTLYWSGQSEFPMAIVAGLLVATFMCAGLGVFAIEAMRRGDPEDH
jgi:hypothetical protein